MGRRQDRAAALIAALLLLALAGCARRQPAPPATVYPYRADAARVFYATSSGLSEMTFQGEAEEELPASRAPNASVISADALSILVAVNGWGAERIEISPQGGAYRLVDRPQPSFAGLSTGGAWPLRGGFLVQLYRDPFSELLEETAGRGASPAAGAEKPGAARLAWFEAGAGQAATPDPFAGHVDGGFETFALLPSGGTWFAELRKDSPSRVELKFLALDDPVAPVSGAREIRRSDFESALRPLPLSALVGETGTALCQALAALGRGPWLARLRSESGGDSWYLSSGSADTATRVFAWSSGSGDGSAVLALLGDGHLASAGPAGTSVLALEAPVEGASFTALAAARGLAAAAWEAGVFPRLSSAGIILCPLGIVRGVPRRDTMKE
jgi:hypothetical protein